MYFVLLMICSAGSQQEIFLGVCGQTNLQGLLCIWAGDIPEDVANRCSFKAALGLSRAELWAMVSALITVPTASNSPSLCLCHRSCATGFWCDKTLWVKGIAQLQGKGRGVGSLLALGR